MSVPPSVSGTKFNFAKWSETSNTPMHLLQQWYTHMQFKSDSRCTVMLTLRYDLRFIVGFSTQFSIGCSLNMHTFAVPEFIWC